MLCINEVLKPVMFKSDFQVRRERLSTRKLKYNASRKSKNASLLKSSIKNRKPVSGLGGGVP